MNALVNASEEVAGRGVLIAVLVAAYLGFWLGWASQR